MVISTPQPLAVPTGSAVVPIVGALHGSPCAQVGAAKSMSTAQQKIANNIFFALTKETIDVRFFMGDLSFSGKAEKLCSRGITPRENFPTNNRNENL
jgi:hypothetical protein